MVSDLLRQSLAEHERAKQLRKLKQPTEAREALIAARDLRQQALAEDPSRTDPAWAAGRVPHDEFMRFYAEQLA